VAASPRPPPSSLHDLKYKAGRLRHDLVQKVFMENFRRRIALTRAIVDYKTANFGLSSRVRKYLARGEVLSACFSITHIRTGAGYRLLYTNWGRACFSNCWHRTDPFNSRIHWLTSTKVFLLPKYACATSTKGSSFREVKNSKGGTTNKFQAQSSNLPCHHDHELWRLGGVVKTITICLGDSSSFLMRQASRVAVYPLLYWANIP
jgi:hypothetical protein